MPFAQQQQIANVIHLQVDFPPVPDVKNQAAMEQWYYEFKTVMLQKLQVLADEVDKLKQKSG